MRSITILRGILSANSGAFLTSNPEWSWILAHLMYGMILGLLLAYGPVPCRPGRREELTVPKTPTSFDPPGLTGRIHG